MYIYAHAINRTLTADPVNGLSNGIAINDATEGIYAGRLLRERDASMLNWILEPTALWRSWRNCANASSG